MCSTDEGRGRPSKTMNKPQNEFATNDMTERHITAKWKNSSGTCQEFLPDHCFRRVRGKGGGGGGGGRRLQPVTPNATDELTCSESSTRVNSSCTAQETPYRAST